MSPSPFSSPSPSHSDLRAHWIHLSTLTLPHLALTHSPTQPTWPVHLDHCFARIIYDHILGEAQVPWTRRVKSPAIQNMSAEQLAGCIALGEAIAAGTVDLAELDAASLAVRGKMKAGRPREEKRKRGRAGEGEEEVEGEEAVLRKVQKGGTKQRDIRDAMVGCPPRPEENSKKGEAIRSPYFADPAAPTAVVVALTPPLPPPPARLSSTTTPPPVPLAHSPSSIPPLPASLSPHTRLVLLALLQIPPGAFTTYGSLARFLASSPRAVGAALRKNPFPPTIPCHRVLAADGGVGGYMGQWGGGEMVERKVELLRGEGVRFDGRGRAVGRAWEGWR